MMIKPESLEAILKDPSAPDDRELPHDSIKYGKISMSGQEVHIAERVTRGFSRFDWYSFDSHLLWLIAKISHEVVSNSGTRIPAGLTVRKSADRVIDLLATAWEEENYYEEELNKEGTSSDINSLIASDRKRSELQKLAVTLFFKTVFPFLPYLDDRYFTAPLTSENSRAYEGYTSNDLLVVRSYLGAVIINGLQMFASASAHGYSPEYSEEGWKEALGKMILSFQNIQVSGSYAELASIGYTGEVPEWKTKMHTEYLEGMNLFIKHFQTLWD